MSRLRRWLGGIARKARGVLGLSLIGGTLTAIAGSVVSAIAIVVAFGPAQVGFASLMGFLAEFAPFLFGLGALASGGFATVLAMTSGRATISELSWKRVAAIGAAIGLLIPVGFVLVMGGPAALPDIVMELFPVFAGFGVGGGLLSASLVAMGKRAEARELGAGEDVAGELPAPSG